MSEEEILQAGVSYLKLDDNSAALMDSFSLKAHGYGELDIPPAEAGHRQSWTLYTPTEDGQPVDLALIDLHGKSILLVMLSHPDEHDALYHTVFLPLVDSVQ